MCPKDNVSYNAIKRPKHIKFDHTKQSWDQTLIVCCRNWTRIVDWRRINVTLNYRVSRILSVLPASFTCLNEPLVQVKVSSGSLVRDVDLYRLLGRTFGYKLRLGLETAAF
jgi:hypothetical protein